LSLAACSGNAPPAWTSAPTTLHLVQGETQSVTLTMVDADGDPVVAKVTSGAVETELGSSAFVVHAGFDAPPADTITVTLDDGRGGLATYPIAVTIDPIGWTRDLQWTTSGPEAREHGTFLIDEASRTAFLIGGSGYQPQGMALADFWKLDVDAGTWSAVTPTGDVPPALASARAVRMPGTTTAYMFGGYTGDGSADTGELYRIEYGGGALAFTKLTQVSQPLPRELHGFGYDPQSQKFVVFGGFSYGVGKALADTWIMQLSGDTATWTKLSGTAPSARYGFFYGTVESTGRFIVFSGAQNPKAGDAINAAQDTWALDLRSDTPSWTEVLDGTEANHAPGRRNGCFVVDPRGPSLYVFGGTSDGMTTQPGLWTLDMRPGHEGFTEVVRPSEPVLRSSDFGFYDAKTGAVSCGFGNSTQGVYTDLASIGP
jgi:hypothetical protein